MKKVLLTLAAVAMAFAANAQFVIGGDLNISHNSNYVTADGTKWAATQDLTGATTNIFDFSISPRIGYQFTEKVQAGIMLTYNTTTLTRKNQTVADPTELMSTNKMNASAFGFGLYGRYNFAQMGKFTVFGQLNLGMLMGSTKFDTKFEKAAYGVNVNGDLTKTTTLAATLVPGLNYAISDCFSVDVYLNFIALNYTSEKEVDLTTTNPEMAQVTNTFNLGTDMDGISIDGLTNAITIGLNWHIGATKAE